MTNGFDQHAINHMTVAIRQEMSPGGRPHPEGDTLFMGGARPSNGDAGALARFGLNKNWKIVFPSFDTADPAAGPIGFHVVVTDGETQSIVLSGGRLWKRNHDSAAVLLFRKKKVLVSLDAGGRLNVGAMRGRFDDRGYALALEAVKARAMGEPGRGAVVAPIGALITVMDMVACSEMFAMAA